MSLDTLEPVAAARAAAEVIALWPQGPPGGVADIGPEICFRAPIAGGAETDILRNVSIPTLTVFRPDCVSSTE